MLNDRGLKYEGNSGRRRRDSLVVRTSRCGRDNPGSNPGHGSMAMF